MQPFNSEERRKAFLSFLLFFIITTAVVGATVLMSVEVPFKQNQQLNAEKEKAEREKDFQERFGREMNTTKKLLDSLKRKEVDVDLIDGKIGQKLQDMDAMIPDSLSGKDFFHDVVGNFSDLRSAIKDLKEANDRDDTQAVLKQQVQDLKRDLDDCKTTVKIYELYKKDNGK
jgi:cell division protein FtsB